MTLKLITILFLYLTVFLPFKNPNLGLLGVQQSLITDFILFR